MTMKWILTMEIWVHQDVGNPKRCMFCQKDWFQSTKKNTYLKKKIMKIVPSVFCRPSRRTLVRNTLIIKQKQHFWDESKEKN